MMMSNKTFFLISFWMVFLTCATAQAAGEKLWYRAPATDWFSALPLGNGRLGAMVFGTVGEEHIQMNEESLWAGVPEDPYPEDVKLHYKTFQDLNLQGKYTEALDYAMSHLAVSPTSFRSYSPLGDLFISLNHRDIRQYRRELDLETGIHTVEYEIDGKPYRREAFISEAYDAMFFRFYALDGGKMEATVRFEREKDITRYVNADGWLCVDGQLVDDPQAYDDNPGGSGKGGAHMKFFARIALQTGEGNVTARENQLRVTDAPAFTVIVSAATDYNPEKMNFDHSLDAAQKAQRLLERALAVPYDQVRREHVRMHSERYNRVDFQISDGNGDELPTDERIQRLKEKRVAQDNYLTQVFFQYGRYLLMGSSAGRATLPANLQGIWNKEMWAPWEADYHLNINLQMNYWPADVCNLSDAFPPLTDFLWRLSKKGETTAARFIGSEGWMAHTATNVFGRTTPSGSTAASQVNNGYCFPLAGAWMSLSLWRHYGFTQDEQYLAERAYPVMKGAVRFILDFLVQNDKGEWVTSPSYSPENTYIHPETGRPIRNTVASTMDIQLVNELFQACLEAERILGVTGLSGEIREKLDRLPEVKIGADGTLQEWYEDYEEAEPGHRHVSHLFGLHPAGQITPATPELYAAALKTLEKRLSAGGGQTGWSRAWVVNFYARFFDGNACNRHLNALITELAAPNLFDLHPPHVFQIDGNLGATAGIAEMLIQSHEEQVIRLLPALPAAWKTGHVRGLKARGAYVIDMAWEDGRLTEATVTAPNGGQPVLIYGDASMQLDLKAGEVYRVDAGALAP